MKRSNRFKKMMAACLACAMLIPPGMGMVKANASGFPSGLCEHHPEHTAECGFVAAVAEQPCNHEHDSTCGYAPASEETACDMGCTDINGDGIVEHAEGCAYQPASEGSPCTHVHDENCGYAEAVPGSPCDYVCKLCNAESNGDADGLSEGTVATIEGVEYDSLQEAVDEATEGANTIVLQKDIQETVSISKDVTIDLNGCTIDGNRQGTVISITDGAVVIQNGTITGGYVEKASGGGICATGGTLKLEDVTVTGNEATAGMWDSSSYGCGGGIYILGATKVHITGCTIENNTAAKKGGGLAVVETSAKSYLKTFIIEDTRVENNACDGGYGYGGGLYLSVGAGLTMSNVQITDNTCVPADASSVTSGGGIYLTNTRNGSIYSLEDVTFEGNSAREGAELYDSSAQSVTVNVKDCTFNGSDYSSAGFPVESAVAVAQNSYWDDDEEYRTFSNCTISGYRGLTTAPMDLQRKATLISCSITDNEAEQYGGIYYYDYLRGTLTLKDTVISGNAATGGGTTAQCGGLYITRGNLTQIASSGTYSAIYGNATNGDNQANDLYVTNSNNAQIYPAKLMSDPDDPDTSFELYVWKDLSAGVRYESGHIGSVSGPLALTAVEEIIRDVAEIDDKKYETLQSAVGDAEETDTIKLIAGDNDAYGSTIDTEPVNVNKAVSIDMNGKNIGPANKTNFKVGDSGALSLTGSGQTQGTIAVSGSGTVRVTDSVQVDQLSHSGGEVYLNTSGCKEMDITLAKGKYITCGSSFGAEHITVHLDSAVLSAINANTYTEDVILFRADPNDSAAGVSTGELLNIITISGWTNRLYSLVQNANGDIVLQKDTTPAVYVNGNTGDDKNDGLSDTAPVKTFEKAKEIAETKNYTRIYVLGTLTTTGDTTWTLPEDTILQRYPTYEGYLAKVQSGTLTLKDIVIDGAGERGVVSDYSLLQVNGGELVLENGSVLQNNNMVQTDTNPYHTGGAVRVESGGSLTMKNGSTVRNNAAQIGGGIYVRGAFGMEGGVIENNRAELPGENTSSAGGGVMLYVGSSAATMEMTGGTIQNNTSGYFGGGISLGNIWDVSVQDYGCHLTMTGGTIQGNTAAVCGGGIFVQMNCTATVDGTAENVMIQNNRANTGLFGGGGIYVNGGKTGNSSVSNPEALEDGVLYLKNAAITDNTAAEGGGGIAGCATSTSETYLESGCVIYGNSVENMDSSTGSAADVLVSYLGLGGTPSVSAPSAYISEYMLGGGVNHWKNADGQLTSISDLHSDGGKNLTNDVTESDPDVIQAMALATVWITGNSAGSYGGGIGSNGKVIIGNAPATDAVVDIPVEKVWNDDSDQNGVRPDSIRIWLLRNGIKIGYLDLSPDADGKWEGVFDQQPKLDSDGAPYTYTVEEEAVSHYSTAVTGDVTEGFIVTNTYSEVLPDPDPDPDTPDQPDTPDEPDNPDQPDTPDEPDDPDQPDTPDEPDTPNDPDTPQTGDPSMTGLWALLSVLSLAGIFLSAKKKLFYRGKHIRK